jgi:hypothetical protein
MTQSDNNEVGRQDGDRPFVPSIDMDEEEAFLQDEEGGELDPWQSGLEDWDDHLANEFD